MKPKSYDDKFLSGMIGVVGAIIFYILIPTIYFQLAPEYIPAELDVTVLNDLMGKWIIGGIPLILLAFPKKYYAYGNVRKVYATVLSAVFFFAWLLYITNMGDLTGIINYYDGDIGMFIDFSMLGLIVILGLLKIITLFISAMDYLDNRDAYAENNRVEETADIRVPGKFD